MKGANPYIKMILVIFQKNLGGGGKWTILGPKMGHPHDFVLAVRIFVNFAQRKGSTCR